VIGRGFEPLYLHPASEPYSDDIASEPHGSEAFFIPSTPTNTISHLRIHFMRISHKMNPVLIFIVIFIVKTEYTLLVN